MAALRVQERREALLAQAQASPATLARLLSASGKGAAAWLVAIPSQPELRLDADLFQLAVASLLGLPIPLDLPATCLCGQHVDPQGVHFLTCKHEAGPILQHDHLVSLYALLGHAAGIVVEREVLHRLHTNGRLDVVLSAAGPHGADITLDVQVVCPTAPSHLLAAREPLGAAAVGEHGKRVKYEAPCLEVGMRFCPAVFEVYGSMGATSLKLFDDVLARVPSSSFSPPNWAASSPRTYWRQRFSVLLQRYNAYIIKRLAFACRRRALPPQPRPLSLLV